MTNTNDFTPENQTNDLRPQVLKKENRFMKIFPRFSIGFDKSLLVALSIASLLVLVVFAMRYASASYQATLKYQVEVVKQEQLSCVELAKRGGQ